MPSLLRLAKRLIVGGIARHALLVCGRHYVLLRAGLCLTELICAGSARTSVAVEEARKVPASNVITFLLCHSCRKC